MYKFPMNPKVFGHGVSRFEHAVWYIGVGGPKRSPHGIGFSWMPGRGRGSAVGGVPGSFVSVRASVHPSVRASVAMTLCSKKWIFGPDFFLKKMVIKNSKETVDRLIL